MRWQRLTKGEREELRKKQLGNWHRIFAYTFKWDVGSRTVYWMEYVWRKGSDWGYLGNFPWRGAHEHNYKTWEYRGGREAPELKQPPFKAPEPEPVKMMPLVEVDH